MKTKKLNSGNKINNVETFANIPWIIINGAQAYADYGTDKSKGTKVFALAGKIKRSGLVEVPGWEPWALGRMLTTCP